MPSKSHSSHSNKTLSQPSHRAKLINPRDSQVLKHSSLPLAGKKVSEAVLLKRKLGRIKAAESIAKQIRDSGIEKAENNLLNSSFKIVPLINQKNYYTDYLKKDDQITFLRKRKELFGLRKGKKSSTDKLKEKSSSVKPVIEDDFKNNVLDSELENSGNGNSSKTKSNPEIVDDDEEEDNEMDPSIYCEKRAQELQTIAIHPGSRNIRIGFVTDAYPKTFPNVIAVKNFSNPKDQPNPIELVPRRQLNDEDGSDQWYRQSKKIIQKDFKDIMRYYKRRVLPNSNETVKNFNKKSRPEVISDLNDPHKIDWIENKEIPKSCKFLVGEKALKLASNCDSNSDDNNNRLFKLRYPIKNGKFNEDPNDYKSPNEVIGDIENILTTLLKENFEELKDIKDFQDFNVVLIIPDLYDKNFVEAWVDLLINSMNFNAISVIQNSIAASFGAGISQACIIDIGAQSTNIACIDEGMVLNDSRINLDYGGDDITNVFAKLLSENDFPFNDFNLLEYPSWKLINDLKERITTFEDANVAIQLYDFIKRLPYKKTEKFQFKVFDEVMISPMALFYPEFFGIKIDDDDGKNFLEFAKCKFNSKLFTRSYDPYTGKRNDPTSLAQKKTILNDPEIYTNLKDQDILKNLILLLNDIQELNNPNNLNLKVNELSLNEEKQTKNLNLSQLDVAIIESITNASKNNLNTSKKFYENILIIGGVLKTPNLDLFLTNRINIYRPRFLSISNPMDIIVDINNEFKDRRNSLIKQLTEEAAKNNVSNATNANENSSSDNGNKSNGNKNNEEEEDDDDKTGSTNSASNATNNAKVELSIDDPRLIELLSEIINERLPSLMDLKLEESNLLPIQVLSPPREIDPQVLCWKGASVFARLKVIHEMWITKADWDLLGNRGLHYKTLFTY